MRIACLYFHQNFQQSQSTQAISEIFYRATPQIMLRGQNAIFLEISKCKSLYSEQSFLRRAQLTLKRLEINAKMAIADDIPTSFCFAYYGIHKKSHLPIEALQFYADPLLKNPEYAHQMQKNILLLKSLGLRKLDDLKKISSREISSRFGSLGLMTYLRVLGENDLMWENFIPSEVVSEKHEFDLESPVENLEPIYFVLRGLLDRAFLRLRGKGRRARQFQVILKQEHPSSDGTVFYEIDIILQLPYLSNKATFQITKEKMDHRVQTKPFQHRICEVSLKVTEEAPYFMNQRDIFDQKKEENDESFFQLVSRLATKLGNTAVFFAKTRESYLPEKNWQRTTEFNDSPASENHVPERPLRIFDPRPVHFVKNKIFGSGINDEIHLIDNKEVILSDWWESPLERIYFRVLTRNGKDLWVFKTKEGYFLQGIFD